MVENKELDIQLLSDNLKELFDSYYFHHNTFSERCIIEKIQRDVYDTIKKSCR